jgi:hypothetical protein
MSPSNNITPTLDEAGFSTVGASTLSEINSLWRGPNRQLAVDLIALVTKFRPYWPMTLRAFYYQAVSALLVKNNQASYKNVGKILVKLRRAELLPWRSTEDKTRHTAGKRGISDVSVFIESQIDGFLESAYYSRCYVQEQDVYCEVTVEKDALSTLVEKAAYMYCTRVTVTKGQISATFLEQMAERFENADNRGQELVLLHFGDLDPTGVQIPLSIQNGLSEHHYMDVDVRRVALTSEQCEAHELPESLDAAKPNDPNIERWYDGYGDQAPTELDALHPEALIELVKDALSDVYDMTDFGKQKEKEREEKDLLDDLRDGVIEYLCDEQPEIMKDAGYV